MKGGSKISEVGRVTPSRSHFI